MLFATWLLGGCLWESWVVFPAIASPPTLTLSYWVCAWKCPKWSLSVLSKLVMMSQHLLWRRLDFGGFDRVLPYTMDTLILTMCPHLESAFLAFCGGLTELCLFRTDRFPTHHLHHMSDVSELYQSTCLNGFPFGSSTDTDKQQTLTETKLLILLMLSNNAELTDQIILHI